MQRMVSPALSATSCEMLIADESNHSAMGTTRSHHSASAI